MSTSEADPMRNYVAEIFKRAADPDETPAAPSLLDPERSTDDPMRDFVAELFGRNQGGADE